MALQMPVVTIHGLSIPQSYIRIDEIIGGKERVSMRVCYYADSEKANSHPWIQADMYSFDPSLTDESPNFIKQGYEYLKTLEEFAQATDV